MKNLINVIVAILITGNFALNAQIKVATDGKIGFCGVTSPVSHLQLNNNNWIRLNAPDATVGILFYEAGTSTASDVQYGAKIFYNEDVDRFNIVTRQNNVDMYGITVLRTYGRVGIAMNSNPSYTLDVNGWVRATGFTDGSDLRLKTDVKDLEKTTVDKIINLRAVTYKPILKSFYEIGEGFSTPESDTLTISLEKVKEKEKSTTIGFVAQEVKEYFPELVHEDDEGYLSVNYIGLIPVLVEAIKEQQSKIVELEQQLAKISGIKPK